MKNIEVHKAQSSGDVPIDSFCITADKQFPDNDGEYRLRDSVAMFDADAELIVSILCKSLPGGTLDRLLGKLLERKASLFVVPMFEPENET